MDVSTSIDNYWIETDRTVSWEEDNNIIQLVVVNVHVNYYSLSAMQTGCHKSSHATTTTCSQLFVGLIWQRIGRQAVGGGGTFAIYNWNWLNNIIN